MEKETLIVDVIINDVNSGKYKSNDKLPSENALAEKYNVPRMTVRTAYVKLQEMGYIYAKQGKGRYLRDRQKQIKLAFTSKASFSQKMMDQGLNYQSKNVFCELIEYDEKIYKALCIDKETRVFAIGRQRIIDEKPIALHISYVPESIFPNIETEGKQIQSMYQYYKEKNYTDLFSNDGILTVSFPTKIEREYLQCATLIPLLLFESYSEDKKTNRILEYTRIKYRSDCFTYEFE